MPDSVSNSDPYALWKNANYRQYAGSWFLITFSRQVEFFAISLYLAKAYSAKHAALAMGIMGLLQALPVILLAIPGGHIADRYNRQRVIAICFSLGIVSSVGVLAASLLGGSIELIFAMLVLSAIGWAVGGPARQAMLANLIPSELFPTGVAWNSSVFHMARVTGPVIAGLLASSYGVWPDLLRNVSVAWHGAGNSATVAAWTANALQKIDPLKSVAPALVVVVLCRIGAIVAISRIRYKPVAFAKTSLSLESVLAGIRFVWRTKLILATITLDLFAVLVGGATYLLSIYAEKILAVGPLGYSTLQIADAVGAIGMTLFLAHRPPLRHAGMTLLWAVAGFGVTTIAFGLSQTFWLSVLMMLMIGAFDNLSVVVRHTLVQMLTPDEMRGRVSAVNGIFIVASNDLGGLESGLTSWLFGPVASVVGGGVTVLLVVLGVSRLWPEVAQIGSLGSIQPISPEDEEYET
jgi:MFS family permease